MNENIRFQWLAMLVWSWVSRNVAMGWRVVCLLLGMVLALHTCNFGQILTESSPFSADDFQLEMEADIVDGHTVYTVTATLNPNLDFSSCFGLHMVLRLQLPGNEQALHHHVASSAFEQNSLNVTNIPGDGGDYFAEVTAQSSPDWVMEGQPWVAWSFEVMDDAPLWDARIGLVQVDVIEGLRIAAASDELLISQVHLMPNPCLERVCARVASGRVDRLQVVGLQGHVLADVASNAPETCLDAQAWPAGLYVLRLWADGRVVHRTRFLKR